MTYARRRGPLSAWRRWDHLPRCHAKIRFGAVHLAQRFLELINIQSARPITIEGFKLSDRRNRA